MQPCAFLHGSSPHGCRSSKRAEGDSVREGHPHNATNTESNPQVCVCSSRSIRSCSGARRGLVKSVCSSLRARGPHTPLNPIHIVCSPSDSTECSGNTQSVLRELASRHYAATSRLGIAGTTRVCYSCQGGVSSSCSALERFVRV